MTQSLYSIDHLLQLMRCLRDPDNGCPWDLKQSLETIVPHTLDEVYEVIDAIERDDREHLKDELGDLLFQVVFYAQICADEGDFDFNQVVDAITRKLLRRHPHVFPDGTLESFGQGAELSEAEIKASWERIKAEERALKGDSSSLEKPASALDDIPNATPALIRAHKVQKRAASVGFDWQSLAPVMANLESEIAELKEAIESGKQADIQDEYGDVLFSCVNLARHLKLDSEQSLRDANLKFEKRFRQVELLATEQGVDMGSATEATLDDLWNQAKAKLQSNSGQSAVS